MGVKIVERLYNEIYTDQPTDWLLGNVGEWQKALITVEVTIEFLATQQKPVQIDVINNSFVLAGGGTWGQYGFDIGMVVLLEFDFEEDTTNDGNFNQIISSSREYTIQNIFSGTMEVAETIEVEGFENIPTNFGTRRITNVKFSVDQDPEGCILKYGHVSNDDFESTTLNSFIDGTTTEFVIPNLSNVGVFFSNMEPIGLQSGMSVRMARIRKVLNVVQEFSTLMVFPVTPGKLQISDSNGSDPSYDTARPVALSEVVQQNYVHSVTNIDVIPQSNSGDGIFSDGIIDQAFIRDVPNDVFHQLLVDITFKITDSERLRQDENRVELVLARYTNGSSMDIVQETVLRSWDNCQSLLNESLMYRGVVDLDLNGSDSVVLAIRFHHERPFNNDDFLIRYEILGGELKLSQPGQPLIGQSKRLYQFEIQYMISSIFDSINNFIDNIPPAFLQGDGSLTDNFEFKFFPEWNNPNTVIQNVLNETARLGNTGWYNENFNQLNNDFEIESVQYSNMDGDFIPSLDYIQPSKIKIIISGVPNLNTQTECGFGFAWIPTNEEDFREKETPFYRNVFVQSGSLDDGFSLDTDYPGPYFGSGIESASIDSEDIRFSEVGGNIEMEITLRPNSSFASLFALKDDSDRNYVLWVSVANGSLERNFSDRVALLADFSQLVKNIPPSGPYPMDTKFIEHPFEENQEGVDIYSGVTQDDILVRSRFLIDLNDNTVFQQMNFVVEMQNNSSGELYELESYPVDLSQSQFDANGFQVFDFDEIRGFKLNDGNNKNFVKIFRNIEAVGNVSQASYTALFAFKLRYEDWLSRNNVPSDFFSNLEENDGQNNDWYDYINTPGSEWDIKFSIYIQASVDDEVVFFRNPYDIGFKDYDQNDIVNTQIRYIRNSDNSLLNIGSDPETGNPLGVILSNELTRVEMDFIIQDSGTWIEGQVYATATIEIDRGAGIFEMHQLSSVWDRESDNPLTPVDGEDNLKIEIDPTGKIATTTCLVDPSLLNNAIRYRITGRIGCFENEDVVDDGGIYESAYETAYE